MISEIDIPKIPENTQELNEIAQNLINSLLVFFPNANQTVLKKILAKRLAGTDEDFSSISETTAQRIYKELKLLKEEDLRKMLFGILSQ